MKKTFLFVLSSLIGVGLFIAVLYHIGINEVIDALKGFSWATLIVVMGLGVIQLMVVVYRWKLVLKAQGDHVPYKKLFVPKLIGNAISFLTPGLYVGGEPVRAYVLKKNTGVRFTHGMASIIIDKILDFTYPMPFLISALIYAMLTFNVAWEVFSLFVVFLVILIVVLILFYIQTYRGKGFFSPILILFRLNKIKYVHRLLEKVIYFENLIVEFFQKRKDIFFKGLLLSTLGGIITFIQFAILLHALGVDTNYWHIFIMMVFMILSFLIPIPASLGTFEAGQAIVFNALNYSPSAGVAFSFTFRIIEVVKAGVGLILLSNVGLGFLKGLNDLASNGHIPERENQKEC